MWKFRGVFLKSTVNIENKSLLPSSSQLFTHSKKSITMFLVHLWLAGKTKADFFSFSL